MIGYIRGEVLENSDGKMLVLTGAKDCGVGYAVSVPSSAFYLSIPAGKSLDLFIHTHVREDALDLYGFCTRAEKELFLTLTSVSGIGPKSALGILSGAEPAQLIQAILQGDKAFLTQVPGIGKKTAERVILELTDPLKKKVEAGVLSQPAGAQARASGDSALLEAKSALIGLGYREQDISGLLDRVFAGTQAPSSGWKVEDLVRTALRQMI